MSSPIVTGTGAPDPVVPAAPPAPTGQAPEGTGGPGPALPPDIPDSELRRENARWRTELREAQAELERLKASSLTGQEKAIAEAKAQGAAEFQAKWRTAVLDNAALTVLAEKRITATELALRALDLSDVDVDPKTGRVDSTALQAKVDALVARYPMLAPDAPPQLPGVGSITGADQRRVQAGNLARTGESEQDALNRLARYALGRGE